MAKVSYKNFLLIYTMIEKMILNVQNALPECTVGRFTSFGTLYQQFQALTPVQILNPAKLIVVPRTIELLRIALSFFA